MSDELIHTNKYQAAIYLLCKGMSKREIQVVSL